MHAQATRPGVVAEAHQWVTVEAGLCGSREVKGRLACDEFRVQSEKNKSGVECVARWHKVLDQEWHRVHGLCCVTSIWV